MVAACTAKALCPAGAAKSWNTTTNLPKLEMKVLFESPLPPAYIPDRYLKNNLLCIQNSGVGGIWEVIRVLEDRRRVEVAPL